jgi:hypothetical protein
MNYRRSDLQMPLYTGHTQNNGASSKVKKKKYFLYYAGTTYTVSSEICPRFSCSCATSSSLFMLTAGLRDQFPRWRRSMRRLCASFLGVQICNYSAAFRTRFKKDAQYKNNVSFKPCTKLALHCITDLDTSKCSTQKDFSCCDAILETGPAVPQ